MNFANCKLIQLIVGFKYQINFAKNLDITEYWPQIQLCVMLVQREIVWFNFFLLQQAYIQLLCDGHTSNCPRSGQLNNQIMEWSTQYVLICIMALFETTQNIS